MLVLDTVSSTDTPRLFSVLSQGKYELRSRVRVIACCCCWRVALGGVGWRWVALGGVGCLAHETSLFCIFQFTGTATQTNTLWQTSVRTHFRVGIVLLIATSIVGWRLRKILLTRTIVNVFFITSSKRLLNNYAVGDSR